MKYYVDYFDFFMGGIANRMAVKNREVLLKYDILCINPNSDKFIFTLTETLLEDSNRILIKYDDFWESGIFKIALSKKYRNAKSYVNDRLRLLSDTGGTNFELDIYNSEITQLFLDEYLENKLKLKGKNTYVEPRTSDADMNNRTLFIKRVTDLNAMYEVLGKELNYDTFNALINDLIERSHDKSQIFQRGYILQDVFLKYSSLCKSRTFMYSLFDQNYNEAMAVSVDATRLSTMRYRINGYVLEQFILSMDPIMYKKLNALSPHELYILINNKSWQLFIEEINELYVYMWQIKKVPPNYDIYNQLMKKVNFLAYSHNFLILIMDRIISMISIPELFWRMCYEQIKCEYKQWWDNYLYRSNYMVWLAAGILKKRYFVNRIIDDIKGESSNGNYI